MKFPLKASSALVAAALALALSAPTAQAVLNPDQIKCQETVAKEGGKFLKATLKEKTKCADKNLKDTGSCDLAGRDEKLDKAESKLRAAIAKKCGPETFGGGLNVPNTLKLIGFPGKCADPNIANGFTDLDLADCIFDTHSNLVGKLFDLEYGANGADGVMDFETQTGNADTAKELQGCQKELGKNGIKLVQTVQKEISKCRNGLEKGTLSGFVATACADNPIETKPGEKIAKAVSKAKAKIQDKCSTPNILLMDVCDTGSGPVTTNVDAANCTSDTHVQAMDDPDNSGLASPFPTDAIDIEYHLAAVCGDNIVNDPLLADFDALQLGAAPEECDGEDDSACDGLCGSPTGPFACLCTDIPRERAIEHDTADLDNGWTGTSHDSTVVEGGGYVVDLYDCDGPGGPDTLCTVGPSCAISNLPCVSDLNCPGLGDSCRKRSTAVGPYCNLNVQQTCSNNADCPGQGNFCRKTPHGIPLPLSSGGIAVCVVNVFSEDITGTTDVATGSFATRIRQRSITHLVGDTQNQPCPTCGGFCNGLSSPTGASVVGRTLCQSDADCPASVACIFDHVCAYGDNFDKPCRVDPPFGNSTVLMGTPSVDCPPPSGANISGVGLDILFNPATSGTVTVPPSVDCTLVGFTDRKCILGSEVGTTCIADSDCTGGPAGSCAGQCFCPHGGGRPQQPNPCNSACRGGGNDYLPCSADSQCPDGFCQTSACRKAAGLCRGGANVGDACAADSDCPGSTCGDADSSDEGFCPAGPSNGTCSFSTIKGCNSDADCKRPTCQFCLGDDSETCKFGNRDCFVNEAIVRTGMVGTPDRIGVSYYCIAQTGNAPDDVAGLPGPGALSQPATAVTTGF